MKHAINVSLVVVLAAVLARPAAAEPVLDLWLTGQLDDTTLTVEVHRANQQFGLGGLHYELQLSETLDLSREYSDFGWVANNGFWDCSNPLDGAAAVSLISATFDTVADLPASEFPADTSGTVEVLTFSGLSTTVARWIYLDIMFPSASDGVGQDLVSELGGSINVIAQDGLPVPHTFGVHVTPEPSTLMLFTLASLLLLRRRKTQTIAS